APGDELGEGTVTDRVAGETLGRKINTDPRLAAIRPQLAARCGAILAAVHRIDAGGLDFLPRHAPADQLAMFRTLPDACDPPLPSPARAAASRPSRSAAASRSRSSTSSISSPERPTDMPASKPDATALLDAAIDYLERELSPSLAGYHRFQLRVTINVLAQV